MSEHEWTHCHVSIPWWYRAWWMLRGVPHGEPFRVLWNLRDYGLRSAWTIAWAVWIYVPQDWGMSRTEIEASPFWQKRITRTYPRTTEPTR